MPQLRQKPSGRPGAPSLPRPTGSLQLAQKRLFSATVGSLRTTLAGSLKEIGSTSTSPAPRFRRPAPRVRELPERLSDVPVPVCVPVVTPATWSDTAGGDPAPASGAATAGADCAGALRGAIPQTLQ